MNRVTVLIPQADFQGAAGYNVHTMPRTTDVTEQNTYEQRFAETIALVKAGLRRHLVSEEPIAFKGKVIEGPEQLWEAMQYAALDAGKLIRPVLTVESCVACGGQPENALPTACAIELVHAQSLIHDDLPCMDNDDLRRGKPTVHKAFSESTAVLTGDALLAMAFGVISKHTPGVSAERLLRVIGDFSDVSSVCGLVNGQFVDIYYENRPFDETVLEYIHTYKTGALFRFSTRAGALLSGADDRTVDALTRFGEMLGLAFQIVDDLLDIQSTSETLGKTTGKDVIQKKATYPALFGEATSRRKARNLIVEATDLLDSLPDVRGDSLRSLADFIGERIH